MTVSEDEEMLPSEAGDDTTMADKDADSEISEESQEDERPAKRMRVDTRPVPQFRTQAQKPSTDGRSGREESVDSGSRRRPARAKVVYKEAVGSSGEEEEESEEEEEVVKTAKPTGRCSKCRKKGESELVSCQKCKTTRHRDCIDSFEGFWAPSAEQEKREAEGEASKQEGAPADDTDKKPEQNGEGALEWTCKKCVPSCDICQQREGSRQAETEMRWCACCWGYYHHKCLPDDAGSMIEGTTDQWRCPACTEHPHKVTKILTHRPYLPDRMETDTETKAPDRRSSKEAERLMYDRDGRPLLEFYVKFDGLSHRWDAWVRAEWLRRRSAGLVRAYEKKHSEGEQALSAWGPDVKKVVRDAWLQVDRIVAQHTDESGRELYYVKWQGLDYEECTFEEDDATERFQKAIADCTARNTRRPKRIDLPAQKFKALKAQPSFLSAGTLHPYQIEGLNWLLHQRSKGISGILADEMGLGKTLQTVSYITCLYLLEGYGVGLSGTNRPCIVIAPLATLSHWVREFAKWAPSLNVLLYRGSVRSRDILQDYEFYYRDSGDKRGPPKFHVLVTSYEMMLMPDSGLDQIHWMELIIDEGHRMKNQESKLFERLQAYRTEHRLLLTGTPLQNNLDELRSMLMFIDQEKFRDQGDLLSLDVTGGGENRIEELHQLLRPHFLRRMKQDVLDLPPKKEVVVPVRMGPLQRRLYRDILSKSKSILTKGSKTNAARSSLQNIAMQLRKCLNHPYLFDEVEEVIVDLGEQYQALVEASGKLVLLDLLLAQLKERGHRCLIFCTMARMLDVLQDYLTYKSYKFIRIDGSTPQAEREEAIDLFNEDNSDIFVFLLTTRAGGQGINLYTADTVFLYDSDYNPQVDLQAIGRAHRIGQTREVMVYRFVTTDSIEQAILVSQQRKKLLEHVVVDKMAEERLAPDEWRQILSCGAEDLFGDEKEFEKVTYDNETVERLLDRTMTEEEQSKADQPSLTLFNNFSKANIWDEEEKKEEEPSAFWDKVLKDAEVEAEKERGEKEAKELEYEWGRRRTRGARVKYYEGDDEESSGTKRKKEDKKKDTEYTPEQAAQPQSQAPPEGTTNGAKPAEEPESQAARELRQVIAADLEGQLGEVEAQLTRDGLAKFTLHTNTGADVGPPALCRRFNRAVYNMRHTECGLVAVAQLYPAWLALSKDQIECLRVLAAKHAGQPLGVSSNEQLFVNCIGPMSSNQDVSRLLEQQLRQSIAHLRDQKTKLDPALNEVRQRHKVNTDNLHTANRAYMELPEEGLPNVRTVVLAYRTLMERQAVQTEAELTRATDKLRPIDSCLAVAQTLERLLLNFRQRLIHVLQNLTIPLVSRINNLQRGASSLPALSANMRISPTITATPATTIPIRPQPPLNPPSTPPANIYQAPAKAAASTNDIIDAMAKAIQAGQISTVPHLNAQSQALLQELIKPTRPSAVQNTVANSTQATAPNLVRYAPQPVAGNVGQARQPSPAASRRGTIDLGKMAELQPMYEGLVRRVDVRALLAATEGKGDARMLLIRPEDTQQALLGAMCMYNACCAFTTKDALTVVAKSNTAGDPGPQAQKVLDTIQQMAGFMLEIMKAALSSASITDINQLIGQVSSFRVHKAALNMLLATSQRQLEKLREAHSAPPVRTMARPVSRPGEVVVIDDDEPRIQPQVVPANALPAAEVQQELRGLSRRQSEMLQSARTEPQTPPAPISDPQAPFQPQSTGPATGSGQTTGPRGVLTRELFNEQWGRWQQETKGSRAALPTLGGKTLDAYLLHVTHTQLVARGDPPVSGLGLFKAIASAMGLPESLAGPLMGFYKNNLEGFTPS